MDTSAYTRINEQIVKHLNAGEIPWYKPISGDTYHYNAMTHTQYKGMNYILLNASQMEHGYESSGWLSMKNVEALGGRVADKHRTGILYASKARSEHGYAFQRQYEVVNVEQVKGLPQRMYYVLPQKSYYVRFRETDAFINKLKAPITRKGNVTYYDLLEDRIHIPRESKYTCRDKEASDLLTMLCFWGYHNAGLDYAAMRKLHGTDIDVYEELIADIAKGVLCAELGIKPQPLAKSILPEWVNLMDKNKLAVFRASGAAHQVVTFLKQRAETGKTRNYAQEDTLEDA